MATKAGQVRARIIRIGNSLGVRIPKALLEETGLAGEVEMTVREGALVVSPLSRARDGWDEAFHAMTLHGDDELLDRETVDRDLTEAGSSDEEPWEWE